MHGSDLRCVRTTRREGPDANVFIATIVRSVNGPDFDVLYDALESRHGTGGLDALARVCADLARAAGATVLLQTESQPASGMGASTPAFAAIEQAQFTLGEGPGIDVSSLGQPVFVEDVAASSHWLHLRPKLAQNAVVAVVALPLAIGAVRIGVLSLYHDHVVRFDRRTTSRLVELAAGVTEAVLALQAGVTRESLVETLDAAAGESAIVHQATGRVAAQLDCDVERALVRLRAHAFANNRTVKEVAADVMSGVLRFSP